MSTNLFTFKFLAAGLLMLLILPACGLLRAEETPVVYVFPTPTPEPLFDPLIPPEVEVDILNMPLSELLAGFPTPTPDTIFIPPTPTHTPVIIVITATPVPTPTPWVDVVLPVTGGDLAAPSSPAPTWSFGLILAGVLLVTFGLFRMRQ